MNAVARKGLVTAMVAGGVLASAGYAQADATAAGGAADSPGVASGNSVQVPLSVPVNACGNTVDVVGLLNPAFGNSCANASHTTTRPGGTGARPAHPRPHPPAGRHAGAEATGRADGSPGVLSGGSAQIPADVPVNVSGNSVNVVGVGNPVFGNTAANNGTSVHGDSPRPVTAPPPAHHPVPAPPNEPRGAAHHDPSLAHTGAQGVGWTAGGAAGLLLCGAALVRRFRPGRSGRG
ncbi:chaplin [Streptomyces sp. HPF1205]|uniref:chaplin n=1 Tax=Streptomyces sp. HPF1205 TaxID=2873262 RepID=UPI001CECC77F|nr:chaplin [Streptomyces sp. HPF1205]